MAPLGSAKRDRRADRCFDYTESSLVFFDSGHAGDKRKKSQMVFFASRQCIRFACLLKAKLCLGPLAPSTVRV